MNQVLNREAIQTDEYYQQEIRRMLEEMSRNNEIVQRDQEEIDWLKQKSRETLKRIDENLATIERMLI